MAVIRIDMGRSERPRTVQPQRTARPSAPATINMGRVERPRVAAQPQRVEQPAPAASASNIKEMLFGAAALGVAAACTIIGAKVAWGLLTEKENAQAEYAPARNTQQANTGNQEAQSAPPAPKIVYEQQPTTIVYKQPQRIVYEERVVVPQRVVYENRVVMPQQLVAPPSVSIGVGIGSGGFAMGGAYQSSMVQPGMMSAVFQDPLIYGSPGYYAPSYYASGSSVAIGLYHSGRSGRRIVNNNYYCAPVARAPRRVVAPRPHPVPSRNDGRVRH